jgi:hypothetical protein
MERSSEQVAAAVRKRPDALCAQAHTTERLLGPQPRVGVDLGVCSSQLPGASEEQSRESSRPAPRGAHGRASGIHPHKVQEDFMSTPASPRFGATEHDTRGAVAPRNPVRRLSTETKAAFKTTEFFSYLAVLAGILIAGAVVDSADAGGYGARQVWLYATILTVGYMVSRGLAKAGSSDPYDADDSNR